MLNSIKAGRWGLVDSSPNMAVILHLWHLVNIAEGVRYFLEWYMGPATFSAFLATGRIYEFHVRSGIKLSRN